MRTQESNSTILEDYLDKFDNLPKNVRTSGVFYNLKPIHQEPILLYVDLLHQPVHLMR